MIDQTTAEVLSKAMDMAKNGIIAGYELIRQNAPLVWAMARRQTQIDGVEYFIASGLFLLPVFWFKGLWRWCVRESDISDGFTYFVGVLATLAILIGTLVCLINGIDLFFNPDWWTLQRLMKLVKH